MADQALTLTAQGDNVDPIPGSVASALPPVRAVRKVARAIIDWFLTLPSTDAYTHHDPLESDNARAARIRRNQEMVHELFAQPGPDAFARFWGGYC